MFEAVRGDDKLPEEFDEVTSEITYPEITERTTEKEFVTKAGNGYMFWAVGASITGILGLALFVWGLYEIAKVL